jgi:hypothetical protein
MLRLQLGDGAQRDHTTHTRAPPAPAQQLHLCLVLR